MARAEAASPGTSMFSSLVLFLLTLTAQQVFKAQLASSEMLTILGGLFSSFLFLFALTFAGNFEETAKGRAGWPHVIVSLLVAEAAALSVHRVSATTCLLFSLGILYEVNKIAAEVHDTAHAGAAEETQSSRGKRR
eukprot:TRINITY_DN6328_c0_g2_i1.p1 TRINITY_DN6328_c0_g2~~TRINITY_DN6328_c0_g2_i1.p1  ORF type:complete len:136 (-),score=32.10 TRINITY_DN6328_c0_g2_i1:475-882(-)